MSNIILVDDDKAVINLCKLKLEEINYTVEFAQSELGALNILENGTFEFAILDYRIGFDNGISLAKKITAKWPEIAIVMITSYAGVNITSESLLAGVDSIVQKPINFDRLRSALVQAKTNKKKRLNPVKVIETFKHVLIVDDSPTYRKMVKEIISEFKDFKVSEAENGEEALEKVYENDISLIFLDYNMPKMNGIEFMKSLRAIEKFKLIPIIMLTTETESTKVVSSYVSGATVYLNKPIDKVQLLKTVQTMRYWHMK